MNSRSDSLRGQKQSKVLLSCAARDLHRRFFILKGEIEHLLRSIEQRMHKQSTAATETRVQRRADEGAFLKRLQQAAEAVRTDIANSLQEVRNIPRIGVILKSRHEAKEWFLERRLTAIQFDAIAQATFRLRANIVSERIGNLHDRLDQFLERSNPDHPGPTRRRRSEQGVQDKYLSELSRWLYRDLARLASHDKYMDEAYPYTRMPSVFQLWDYERSSRHHSYLSNKGYQDWSSWRDGENRSPNDDRHGMPAAGLDVQKFVTIQLPYWIPECPEFQPLIAHELAHQVLRDIFGHEVMQFAVLENSAGGVSRMLRRLTACIEAWTAGSNDANSTDHASLPIEILCDALAATRCGVAYVYALYIEFLDNEVLADLSKDSTGRLEAIQLYSENEIDETNRAFYRQAEQLSTTRKITWLLRLGALIRFVEAVLPLDDMEMDLVEGIRYYIDDLIGLYAIGEATSRSQDPLDSNYARSLKEFTADIATALVGSGFLGSKSTPLRETAERFWSFDQITGSASDFYLGRQLLGSGWMNLFSSKFEDSRNKSRQLFSTDLPWRCLWKHLSAEAESPSPNLFNRLPDWMPIALEAAREDYLFRTTNAAALFALLGYRLDIISATSAPNKSGTGNENRNSEYSESSVLDHEFRSECHQDWEKFLGEIHSCASEFPEKMAGSRIQLTQVTKALKTWVPSVFPSAGQANRWFKGGNRFRLDLLSIAVGNKVECYLGDSSGNLVQYSPQEATSIPETASAVLLGRYDCFVLISNTEKDLLVEAPYKLRGGASYTSRRRSITHALAVGVMDRTTSANEGRLILERAGNAVCLVLVGLHWPAARMPFLIWLESKLAHPDSCSSNYEMDIYLSDGWEDICLFLKPKLDSRRVEDIDFVSSLGKFVEDLNSHPFVNQTETIFSTSILEDTFRITPERVDISFNCRISPIADIFPRRANLQQEVAQLLEKELSLSNVKVLVDSAYGLTDYRVRVKNWSTGSEVRSVLRALYQCAEIHRLDTRVAFLG